MVEDDQCQAAPFGRLPAGYDPGDPLSSRRVKPLPKRRRTIARPPAQQGPPPAYTTDLLSRLPEDLARALHDGGVGHGGAGWHAPIFSGVPGLFGDDIDSRHVAPVDFDGRSAADGGRLAPAAATYAVRQDDGDAGDYVDFIRRPNNTKKRKVPVAAHARRDDGAVDGVAGEEALADRLLLPSAPDRALGEAAEGALPPWSTGAAAGSSHLSRAARAALQHKELLKSRKRQLAAVLGAISLGDPLALDQALSSPYFLPRPAKGPNGQAAEGPAFRASRRLARRKARTLALSNAKTASGVRDENAGLWTAEFTFEERSATSERLRATKQEVATLHKRFEEELARRAAQQQLQQQQAATAVGSSPVRKSKQREGRSQPRARIGNGADGDVASLTSNKIPASAKTKSKKTKRSALANASNPHHLRNYVPSRLPHQGGGGGSGNSTHPGSATSANAQNYLGLFPLRFLSAALPRRRGKKGGGTASATFATNLTKPEEEWICPFCEYDLFYGDEQSYRRAIRQRKKILARRRRAMERAAAAAAGRKAGVAPSEYSDSGADDDEDDELADAAEDGVGAADSKPTKGRERDKERG